MADPNPEKIPPPSREYHQSLQPITGTSWRSALSLTAFTVSASTLILTALPLSNTIDNLLLGSSPNLLFGKNPSTKLSWTPGLLLTNNLLLAAQTPVSMIIERVVYKKPWGALSSVENRFRWELAVELGRVIIPATVLYYGGTLALFRPSGWPDLSIPVNLANAAIALFTAPLQSAAEEYVIRGLLQRIFASWFPTTVPSNLNIHPSDLSFWGSTALTSLLFASIHLSHDPWSNIYYTVAAISGSLMTRWTGGLEASVLVHAATNVVIFLPMMLAGNMALLEDVAAGKGVGMIAVVPTVGLVGLTWWVGSWARKEGVRNLEQD